MTWLDIALQVSVLTAAFLQTVTGIGFALIAGPVILLVTASQVGMPVSALLSILISVTLLRVIWRDADPKAVRRLATFSAVGLLPGALLFATADATDLKLIAGVVLAGLIMLIMRGPRAARSPGAAVAPGRIGAGLAILSGALGGALAMPGPTAAVGLARAGYVKRTSRASILGYFLVFYPLVFGAQWAVAGLPPGTLGIAASLVPATLVGTLAGTWVEPRVNEALYRRLVLFFLCLIALSLMADALGRII